MSPRIFLGQTVAAAIAGSMLLCPTDARAFLVFTANTVFNGDTPTSTPPWLTATFSTVSPGTVTLQLSANLNVASEFIDDVNFNVDPAIIPSSLTFTPDPGNSGFAPAIITNTTDNAQNLTGGGAAGSGFDVNIAFDNAPPPNRFDGTNVAKYTITDISDSITESSFNFTNSGSANAKIGVHIQGIPVPGGGTTSGAAYDGPAQVPEPSSMALLGVGLAGIGILRRRRRV